MDCLNILIADLTHTSAYFLRSILRAHGHRVSIAFNEREALDKVATGLFDLVMADAHPFATDTGDLFDGLRATLPDIPALLVTDLPEGGTHPLSNVFSVLPKPVRIPTLRHTLARAAEHLDHLREHRRHTRRTVDLPVELSIGHRRVLARAINLSLGGVQVDTGEGDAWRILSLAGGDLRARLSLGTDGATLELPARLAYVDGTDGMPEHVGLAFGSVASSVRSQLQQFLTAA